MEHRMIAFDFSPPKRPAILQRLFDIRVPSSLKAPIGTALVAVAIVFAAYCIEVYRLNDALRLEALSEQRLQQSEALVQQTKIRYAYLQQRIRLDRRIHEIQASGYNDSRLVAEIANRLPRRAWLDSIARESDQITLDGEAGSLRDLSATIKVLAASRYVRAPVLVSAAESAAQPEQREFVKYQLKIGIAK
jgi:Tfp pilus assembly protein PilN